MHAWVVSSAWLAIVANHGRPAWSRDDGRLASCRRLASCKRLAWEHTDHQRQFLYWAFSPWWSVHNRLPASNLVIIVAEAFIYRERDDSLIHIQHIWLEMLFISKMFGLNIISMCCNYKGLNIIVYYLDYGDGSMGVWIYLNIYRIH